MNKVKRIHVFIIAGVVIATILGWAFMQSTKPLPGIETSTGGLADHVAQGSKVDYDTNPPTHGTHYETWIKAGVFDTPQIDGNLVHSLEHGYIIISYNCDKKVSGFKLVPKVLAHGIEEATEATSSVIEATNSAKLSASFRSSKCHDLVDRLISIYESKGKRKIIITPRPNLDTLIALTAWGRMDKFDQFDENRIGVFIDELRDKGPEQTME